MKVLLIDDHPLILTALQNVIRSFGDDVDVVGVPGGRSARQKLAEESDFDLFLLDLHLGDCDGFELLTELRNAWPRGGGGGLQSDRGATYRSIERQPWDSSPRAPANTLQDALQILMKGGSSSLMRRRRSSRGRGRRAVATRHAARAPRCPGRSSSRRANRRARAAAAWQSNKHRRELNSRSRP